VLATRAARSSSVNRATPPLLGAQNPRVLLPPSGSPNAPFTRTVCIGHHLCAACSSVAIFDRKLCAGSVRRSGQQKLTQRHQGLGLLSLRGRFPPNSDRQGLAEQNCEVPQHNNRIRHIDHWPQVRLREAARFSCTGPNLSPIPGTRFRFAHGASVTATGKMMGRILLVDLQSRLVPTPHPRSFSRKGRRKNSLSGGRAQCPSASCRLRRVQPRASPGRHS
jgi:hypothetical protein